jgi:acetoin utilization deacetylase AcuC-like enzyme
VACVSITYCCVQDTGIGKGKNYALNFPFRDGINDENYKNVFEPASYASRLEFLGSIPLQVIQQVMDSFDPGAIVLQCGSDSLAGDKIGPFNLSMRGTRTGGGGILLAESEQATHTASTSSSLSTNLYYC